MTGRHAEPKGSGRGGDAARAELLEAARRLFLQNEFRAVTVRRIAEAAGVNGAMISYYFGGKRGLYQAMVEDLADELERSLAESGGAATVEEFAAGYSRLLARNRWWPNFVVREVLFGEEETRRLTVRRLGGALAPRLLGFIEAEIAAGRYRADLDPRLALVSLVGMTAFPFLAAPVIESVFGLRLDAALAETLAGHNTRLFLEGAAARPGDGR